jgi:membrane protein
MKVVIRLLTFARLRSILARGMLYFIREGCTYRAAALAYSTLLTLVPLMMVTLLVMRNFPGIESIADQAQHIVLESFVSKSASQIIVYLQSFAHQVLWLGGFSIGLLFGVCLLMIYNMNRAVNAIWGIKRRRHLLAAFLIYFILLIVLPIFMGLLVVVASYMATLPLIAHLKHDAQVSYLLVHGAPVVMCFVAFFLLNWLLPATKVPVKFALIGALFVTVLFELAKYVFNIYTAHFSSYHVVYGAIALLPIFLIWMYISWVIILFGVIVTRLLTEESRVVQLEKKCHD